MHPFWIMGIASVGSTPEFSFSSRDFLESKEEWEGAMRSHPILPFSSPLFLHWGKAKRGSLTLNELLHSLGQHPIHQGISICGWPKSLGWWLPAMAILDQRDDEFLGGF